MSDINPEALELAEEALALDDDAQELAVDAVAKQVQIRLDHVGALLYRERKGLERVLERVHRRAAMRDVLHQRIPPIGRPSARSTARSQPA